MSRLPAQPVNGDVVVHTLAAPAATGGAGVDGMTAGPIEGLELLRAAGRASVYGPFAIVS